MIVYFKKDELLTAIGPAMGVVSNKNTVTSIEGILIDCKYGDSSEETDTCTLSAYDMEKGMRTTVAVKIDEPGNCIINAQKLHQIIKALPDGELKITVDEKMRCTIEGGKSAFELRALPGEDFPNLPELRGDRGFSVPQYIIKNFISKTAFAVGVNEQKASFNGFYLKFKDSNITVVACDGTRLALCKKDCDVENKSSDEKPLDGSCIIPGKSMAEISKLVKDSEDQVEIYLARKHVIFKIGAVTFFSRLIEGEYFDYERIISQSVPKGGENHVYINPQEFKACLERAALITEERTAGTTRAYVKLTLEDQLMKISSVATNGSGSAYDEIAMDHRGDDMAIGFNCRYLLDAMRTCLDAGDEVKISLSGPEKGIIIVPSDKPKEKEDAEKDDFLFFVLPLRMNAAN